MKQKGPKKRLKIPIDFDADFQAQLKAEAELKGLKFATYVKSLLITHPDRKASARR